MWHSLVKSRGSAVQQVRKEEAEGAWHFTKEFDGV